jgi:transcriptional regulator GlxA family with amidase domain
MLVHSGRILTAGAALSHMDMALWLIRQASPSLAAVTARYLIVDTRVAQSAYAIVDHLTHADPRESELQVVRLFLTQSRNTWAALDTSGH